MRVGGFLEPCFENNYKMYTGKMPSYFWVPIIEINIFVGLRLTCRKGGWGLKNIKTVRSQKKTCR